MDSFLDQFLSTKFCLGDKEVTIKAENTYLVWATLTIFRQHVFLLNLHDNFNILFKCDLCALTVEEGQPSENDQQKKH